MNLGAQLGPLSITKLSPIRLAKWAPFIALNFCCLGRFSLQTQKGSTLVSSVPCVPMVQLPLQPPRRDLGQVLHLQLPAALQRVNSGTVEAASPGLGHLRKY